MIPLLDLKLEYIYMKPAVDRAIKKCLAHQQWILGPEVRELEEKTARYLVVKYCSGVASGTDALVIALRALARRRFKKNYFDKSQRIITTPLTFTATGDAILRSGATPLFVDIDPQTFNIDAEKVAAAVTSDVVGIVPVHLYGQACQMDAIMSIARRHKLFVVEDVAQAFGGKWGSRKLGSIGDAGCFSFFPSKNLGGFGDGGLIATNDAALHKIIQMLQKHGGEDKCNAVYPGYNSRLDTLQAAVLLAKLKYIDILNKKRQAVAKVYHENLSELAQLDLPPLVTDHVFHQFTIKVRNNKRDRLKKYLKQNGIDSAVYYPILLHKMPLFKKAGRCAGKLPQAESVVKKILSLPVGPLYGKTAIGHVCKIIKKFFLN